MPFDCAHEQLNRYEIKPVNSGCSISNSFLYFLAVLLAVCHFIWKSSHNVHILICSNDGNQISLSDLF